MKDSSPMTEARYEIIAKKTINPKNQGGHPTFDQMVDKLRILHSNPRAMIEARRKATSHGH